MAAFWPHPYKMKTHKMWAWHVSKGQSRGCIQGYLYFYSGYFSLHSRWQPTQPLCLYFVISMCLVMQRALGNRRAKETFICRHAARPFFHQRASAPLWSGTEINAFWRDSRQKERCPCGPPAFLDTSVLVFRPVRHPESPVLLLIVAGTRRSVDKCVRSTCLLYVQEEPLSFGSSSGPSSPFLDVALKSLEEPAKVRAGF